MNECLLPPAQGNWKSSWTLSSLDICFLWFEYQGFHLNHFLNKRRAILTYGFQATYSILMQCMCIHCVLD